MAFIATTIMLGSVGAMERTDGAMRRRLAWLGTAAGALAGWLLLVTP